MLTRWDERGGSYSVLVHSQTSEKIMSRRWLMANLVLVLALSSAGCHDDSKVSAVRGRVLVNGKPASQALVTFHPTQSESAAACPSGQTDEQGYFTLTTFAGGDGAPAGEYAVAVTWFRPVANRSAGEFTTRNFLPVHYADPKKSRLSATIGKGTTELPAFNLSTK